MSANISSTTLFHFTGKMEHLKSILKKGFYPRYCAEHTLDQDDRIAAARGHPPLHAVPMVCFCDLTMGVISKHQKYYGPYGIGLDREWGLKHGLSPVIYTHDNAGTRGLALRLAKNTASIRDRAVRALSAYCKPYRGPAWRDDEVEHDVKFYDEREWRYVPKPLFVPYKKCDTMAKRKKLNDKLRMFKLPIDPKNVQYLILPFEKDEENVLELHKYVMELYGKRFGPKDAALVATTIMTDNAFDDV